MATLSAHSTVDPWDQPSTSTLPVARKPISQVVRDDWDDSDDDELETDNANIWENANAKAPMPELVITSTNTGSPFVSPPPAVLQPAMRILKRPSPSPPSLTSSPTSVPGSESLAQREARYQAARDRIFGDESVSQMKKPDMLEGKGTGRVVPKSNDSVNAILREPIGPAEEDGRPSRGFGRKERRGPVSVHSSSAVTSTPQ